MCKISCVKVKVYNECIGVESSDQALNFFRRSTLKYLNFDPIF